jgi:hypothetical protein
MANAMFVSARRMLLSHLAAEHPSIGRHSCNAL